MTQHSSDANHRDDEEPTGIPEQGQEPPPESDVPAIDVTGEPPHEVEAPPLDVDERGEPGSHTPTPDVIELGAAYLEDETAAADDETTISEFVAEETTFANGEPAAPPDDEAVSVDDTIPPAAQDVVEAHEDTSELPTPPNVSGEDDTFTPLQTEPAQEAGPEPSPAGQFGPDREQPARAEGPKPGEPSRAQQMLGGFAARLRSGAERGRESVSSAAAGDATSAVRGPLERISARVQSFFDPRLHMFSTVPYRRIIGLALALVFIFLLANSGGLALITLSSVVPLLVLVTLTQHDVFEKENNLIISGVAAAGAVAGLILGGLASWVQGEQWFDTGKLNYGAAGFGGRFAENEGSAPFVVWLLVGLVIPALALVVFGGLPIALRRWPQFRNEVMDGVILGGASAAGFAIGAAIVYWWPMISERGPQTSVSDWTLSVLGVSVLRPIVITLCGAMVGAGVWRYLIRQSPGAVVTSAIGGIGGFLLLSLGSIQFQSSGLWPEFLWTVLVLAGVFILYRNVLDHAVAHDRRALGDAGSRIICPACHRLTPIGKYCAHCGHQLPDFEAVPEPGAPSA